MIRQDMKLHRLVAQLDKEFEISKIRDDWDWFFDELFLQKSEPSFRKPHYQTGLVIKNSDDVEQIYTAFAPSTTTLRTIKGRGRKNSLLVVKHPFAWDGKQGFLRLTEEDYALMEEMGVSLYSLHTPFDKNRDDEIVSTAYAFARTIGLRVEGEFGAEGHRNPTLLLGVVGSLSDASFGDLVARLSALLQYDVKTMRHDNVVGKVAIVTGGGFVPRLVEEAKASRCHTYITGIITPQENEFSKANYPAARAAIEQLDMNLIGASHYLTERDATKYSVGYFQRFCPAEFIEDNPRFE